LDPHISASLDRRFAQILRWKVIPLQLAVISFSLITVALYIFKIPNYYKLLVSKCVLEGCEVAPSVPTTLAELEKLHLSLEAYAMLFVIIDCTFTFLYYAAALIILWKGFREPMGLLAALAMVAFGSTFPSLIIVATEGDGIAYIWFMIVSMVGWISLYLFCFLFPDGVFVPKWTLYVFGVMVSVNIWNLFAGGGMWDKAGLPMYIPLVYFTLSTAAIIYSQIYRFRKVSEAAQRQQTKWVVYGVSIGLIGFVGVSMLFEPSINGGGAMIYVYLNAILHLFLLAIPFTLTMAILRRRLWDIDPLVNRTLVFAALSICVVVLYTLSVLYLSRMFKTEDNFVISLIATSIVAVAFAPLKDKLQRMVHRLMKGRHDDPYAVLLELGKHLVQPLTPESMLDVIVKTVKESLRLPYAGISIGIGGQETRVAAAGEAVDDDLVSYPIIHRGEELGTLYIARRSPGEVFSSEDSRFLDVLLHQAGPIVENVNMTLGMKLLAQDLQESRERLILAREEERREIRNNLHDDLAPRLAALAINAAVAEKYVKKEPDTAIDMLGDLRKVIRSTVDEIRTLVHDLRPPTLDELGLIGAVQERINELSKPTRYLTDEHGGHMTHIQFHHVKPLPAMPAAVEVAAYRIVTESLVNVIRHAQATACTVRLEISEGKQLLVEVTDNGAGIQPQAQPSNNGGIGLRSIKERAIELGGQCLIERMEQGGTRILAMLPLYEGG
jgi:signal transduction histidine kinase